MPEFLARLTHRAIPLKSQSARAPAGPGDRQSRKIAGRVRPHKTQQRANALRCDTALPPWEKPVNKDDDEMDPAERLYAEGKRFDWKQDKSPAAATLARANFQQAASMGHKGAVRAVAHMIYEGRGGGRDQAKGLLLLWSAFRRGDQDALEEFVDLLATYGDESDSAEHRRVATPLAKSLEEVNLILARTTSFMYELARVRAHDKGAT